MFFPCLLQCPCLALHIWILHHEPDFTCVQPITSANCIFSLDTCYPRWDSNKYLFLGPTVTWAITHLNTFPILWALLPKDVLASHKKKVTWTSGASFSSLVFPHLPRIFWPLTWCFSYFALPDFTHTTSDIKWEASFFLMPINSNTYWVCYNSMQFWH